MPAIALNNVRKRFATTAEAVRGVSLTIADGELLALLGASGSGKTTVLRLIAGLEKPTAGSISVNGRLVVRGGAHRMNVAMCFQSPALYPHLHVRENLVFGCRIRYNWFGSLFGRREPPELERRVQEVASLLDVVPLLGRKPAELSGGERQRVALGRALLREPAVLLLDEPLAHVDGPLRDRLRQALRQWQCRHRMTVIWVTHDSQEALSVGDRLGILHDGVLQQTGTAEEVAMFPATIKVAERVGNPPWNLLTGRLTKRDGGTALVDGDAWIAIPHDAADGLMSHCGRLLCLGLRPAAIRMIGEVSPDTRLCMSVELLESAGDCRLAVLAQGKWRMRCKVENLTPTVGDRAFIEWDWRQARWFDGEVGTALPIARSSMEA
jgi:ABC-type sugar transport system ATPase subunit